MLKNSVAFPRPELFLELPEPLSVRYETNQYTGEAGIDDPGPHIKTGYVKRDIDREVDPCVYSYLDSAEERFRSCPHVLESENMY